MTATCSAPACERPPTLSLTYEVDRTSGRTVTLPLCLDHHATAVLAAAASLIDTTSTALAPDTTELLDRGPCCVDGLPRSRGCDACQA